jgi:hypothetical protein
VLLTLQQPEECASVQWFRVRLSQLRQAPVDGRSRAADVLFALDTGLSEQQVLRHAALFVGFVGFDFGLAYRFLTRDFQRWVSRSLAIRASAMAFSCAMRARSVASRAAISSSSISF